MPKLKTNQLTIVGSIVDRSDIRNLHVGNSEGETQIQQVHFAIQTDDGLFLHASARSDIGTAFHSLKIDRRLRREGTRIKATGYLIGFATVLLIAETLHVDTHNEMLETQDTDIHDLSTKTQDDR